MMKLEKKIITIIENNYLVVMTIVMTVLALLVRCSMLTYESLDYLTFLSPWFDYMKENGGLKALATYPGDYNAPYMTILAALSYLSVNKLYLIKSVSIVFDFALAFSSAILVRFLVEKKQKIYMVITYSTMLFIPPVLINSGYWAQCDSLYATFVIIALIYLLDEKYIPSFISLGVSFSFKLQFIFILPLFVVLYICKKQYSILHFLIIPITDIILCIPAIIVGKPLKECLMIYIKQTGTYKDSLVLNYPNVYNLIGGGRFGYLV